MTEHLLSHGIGGGAPGPAPAATVAGSLPGGLLRETAVLGRARVQALANTLRLVFRAGRLRLATFLVVASTFWGGLFYLFYRGFLFIDNFAEFKTWVLGRLFGLFFVTLMVMLVFSNGIISYLSLFRSRETGFLMSQPVSAKGVFAYKFCESLFFSSWAFLLLGTPLLVAYGVTSAVPWYFYATFFAFFPPFVVIPAAVGAVAAVLVAAWVPRTRLGWLTAGLVAAGLVAMVVLLVAVRPGRTMLPFSDAQLRWFFARLRFTQDPLLPSRWMTQGILAAARADLSRTTFYLLVLLSNALFAGMLAFAVAGRVYAGAWQRVQSGRRRRRRPSLGRLEGFVHRAFFYLPGPARLLLAKDLRTFRRDPAQWSQFIIFFGILAAYIGNLRSLAYHLKPVGFRGMVSLLNLSVVAMVVATFACRFVFPLVSLEGRNFWLLGLAPIRRRSVLVGKFVFAAAGAALMSLVLVVTSDLLLRSPVPVVLLDVGAMLLMSLGIAGISVGLGARLPNLQEDNPSKIAAGFGGTLDLIVSLFYIALTVALMAWPAHAAQVGRGREFFSGWGVLLVLAAVGVTALAVAVPVTLGTRHFRRMEF